MPSTSMMHGLMVFTGMQLTLVECCSQKCLNGQLVGMDLHQEHTIDQNWLMACVVSELNKL